MFPKMNKKPSKYHLFNPKDEKGKGTTAPLSSDSAFMVALFTPRLYAGIMM